MSDRIGLVLPNLDDTPLPVIVEGARLADRLGYELALVPEAWGRDALVVLAHLAGQTERIGLGTGIVNVFSRSPAVLGMATATLDELSGGRMVLGLGTSGPGVIEGWHGLKNERPLQRLQETIDIVSKVLRRDRSAYEGKCFTLAPGFAMRFKPPRAQVPVYLASLSAASIRLAGRKAQGWLPYLLPQRAYPAAMAWLAEGLRQAGRPRASVTVAPFLPAVVDDDLAAARAPVKGLIAFYIGGMGTYYHRWVSQHGYAEAADAVRAAWLAGDRQGAAALVPDDLVDQVAVCGPVDRCRAALAAFRAVGVDLPLLSAPPGVSVAGAVRTLQALAPS